MMNKNKTTMTEEELMRALGERLAEAVVDFLEEVWGDDSKTIEKSGGEDHYLKGLL